MSKVTVAQVAGIVLPTAEVEVPEWDGTVTVRALTRGQVRACRQGATLGEDNRLDLDTYDLLVLAYGMADPDLIGEGEEEALRLLRAQPVPLVYRLVREVVALSGLGPDAQFRRRTGDDERRDAPDGPSDHQGAGGDDRGGDESEDEPPRIP